MAGQICLTNQIRSFLSSLPCWRIIFLDPDPWPFLVEPFRWRPTSWSMHWALTGNTCCSDLPLVPEKSSKDCKKVMPWSNEPCSRMFTMDFKNWNPVCMSHDVHQMSNSLILDHQRFKDAHQPCDWAQLRVLPEGRDRRWLKVFHQNQPRSFARALLGSLTSAKTHSGPKHTTHPKKNSDSRTSNLSWHTKRNKSSGGSEEKHKYIYCSLEVGPWIPSLKAPKGSQGYFRQATLWEAWARRTAWHITIEARPPTVTWFISDWKIFTLSRSNYSLIDPI